MIFISRANDKFFLKVSSKDTYEFNTFVAVCRKWHLTFDDSVKGYIHANPRVLLDTLYELADEFETFVSDKDKEAIQNCELFVPSFKPKRRRLNKKYFEDYPPLGQFQVDDVHKMFSFGRCINACKQGLGKAQPNSAKVLTIDGWKFMGDIIVGDLVVNEKGTFSKVLQIFPQGIKDIYTLTFSDGSATRACKDHLWTYQTHNDFTYKKGFTRTATVEDFLNKKVNHAVYIPIIAPVQFPKKNLVLDPWLMGVLLGNGSFLSGSACFSTSKQYLVNRVSKLLEGTNLMLKYRGHLNYCLSSGQAKKDNNFVLTEIKKQGLLYKGSKEKFIPYDYLFGSVEQRLALLTGLIDTDGYVSKDGYTLQYSTSSEQLKDGVAFLIQSLGGIVRISSKIPRIGKKEYSRHWTLTIRMPSTVTPISIPEKLNKYVITTDYKPIRILKSVKLCGQEEATCILIDSDTHLYATDNCIITHNTYSAIQTVNQIIDSKEADVVLVVAIPAVLYNWKREFLRFSPFFKEEDFQIVTEKERDIFTWKKIPPVLITTYDTLRLISDFHFCQSNPIKHPEKKTEEQIKAYKSELKVKAKGYRKEQIPFEKWGKVRILFLDEAHKMKNMKARRTKIVHMHKHYFDFRYPMTGTPTPQGIQDIYSLVKVLDDNLIEPDYYAFLQSIAVLGTDRSEWAIDHLLPENVAKFEERIKPYIIRRFLRDHVNIPQVHEKRIYVPLEQDQEELYKMLVNDLIISIKKENNGRLVYKEVHNRFPYISQILSDPLLLQGKIQTIAIQHKLNGSKFSQNAKVKALHNILDSIYDEDASTDEKVLLWCEHPDTIDRLAVELKKYNPVVIHGSNTPKGKNRDQWRDEQVQDIFKKDNKRKILIANPKCLGVGTNLQFCHNIVYYDRSYDFIDVDQSFSRVERAGLDKEAFYWYILIDNSLDIYQDKILEDKKLQDALFLKQSLSKADCQYIFMGKEYEKQLRDIDMEST
jgi:hypothetical protein